jgi:hypothetical protein
MAKKTGTQDVHKSDPKGTGSSQTKKTGTQDVRKPDPLTTHTYSGLSKKGKPGLMKTMDLKSDIQAANNDVNAKAQAAAGAQAGADKVAAAAKAANDKVATDLKEIDAFLKKNPGATATPGSPLAKALDNLKKDQATAQGVNAKALATAKDAANAQKALDDAKAKRDVLLAEAKKHGGGNGGGGGSDSGGDGGGGSGGGSGPAGDDDGGFAPSPGNGSSLPPVDDGPSYGGQEPSGLSAPRGQDMEARLIQGERFIRVQNDTGKAVTIYVQCYARTTDGWAWLPAEPGQDGQGLAYDLDAGETTHLAYQGQKLKGSRIRFWVDSDAGEWNDCDQDLWLVPEVDQRGNHVYRAAEIETFPLRLSR